MTTEEFNSALAAPEQHILGWIEPLEGRKTDGAQSDVCVEMRATAAGCIERQRYTMKFMGRKDADKMTDEQLLSDFVVIYMASIIKL